MESNLRLMKRKRGLGQNKSTLAEVKTNGRILFKKSADALLENKVYCMLGL